MSENIIQQVRQALHDCIDPKSLQSSNRFFKPGEQAKVYGVRMAEVGKIAKEFYKTVSHRSKADTFALARNYGSRATLKRPSWRVNVPIH